MTDRQPDRYDKGQYRSADQSNDSELRPNCLCHRNEHGVHAPGAARRDGAARADPYQQRHQKDREDIPRYIHNESIRAGFDPEFGARPVKRAIQQYLLNDLSKRILGGEVDREKEIVVDAAGSGLTFASAQ